MDFTPRFRVIVSDSCREREDFCEEDNLKRSPKAIYTWLATVYYQRRSKFNPLWNQLVVAGCKDGKVWNAAIRAKYCTALFGNC